mmetsp:Transcript_17670/g.43056  ORF Transcript_17670/g.43056 Transcript_17670/m.43056 type:complete len:610 (-) Transcript_17670:218-2047(-)
MKFLPLHSAFTVSSCLVAVASTIVVSTSGVVVDGASSSSSLSSSSSASFVHDVIGKKTKTTTSSTRGYGANAARMNDELLAKAVPLEIYKANLRSQGLHLPNDNDKEEETTTAAGDSRRRLDEQAKYYYYQYNDDGQGDDANQQQDDGYDEADYQNEDDYYVASGNYIGFNGFSLKYARCQPVQHFSPNAVNSGEYSPMVLDDIVILRLCPSLYCSNSRDYGCFYDYAEYAINVRDYIRIMLRWKMDRENQLCDYCQTCAAYMGRRRTEQSAYGGSYGSACNGFETYCFDSDGDAVCNNNERNRNLEDAAQGDDAAAANDDAAVQGDDNNQEEEAAEEDAGDDGYYTLDAEGYLDIIDCVQVEGGYFIRPRCDGYTEQLSMGVFHDKFCSQYAGDSMDISKFNLGVNKSYFEEFAGESGCMDCSEMEYPPYFNANSNLCNRLDISSARCTANLESDLFSNSTHAEQSSEYSSAADSEECSYIETLRSGAYDEKGQLYSNESRAVSRSITRQQKILLSLSVTICVFLAVYACYLHHTITNLLIKSLSHTDLLPASRHRRRSPRASSGGRSTGGRSRRSSRSGSRSRKRVTDDEDDDDDTAFEMRKGATRA